MLRSLLAMLLMASAVQAKDAEPHPWQSFVPGRFAVIGQWPGGGATYSGEASIEARGNGFVLRRTIAGKTVEAAGRIEVPSPPGEGSVLRFRWKDGGEERLMTCLVASDLDNYARLTCLWGAAGREPAIPGREAYFASQVQPAE